MINTDGYFSSCNLSILEGKRHPVIESTRGGIHLECMATCDSVWVRGGAQINYFMKDKWQKEKIDHQYIGYIAYIEKRYGPLYISF